MTKKDKERQERIELEIIVDACDESEVQMGWVIQMVERTDYPFFAEAPIKKRGQEATYHRVEVVELGDVENYEGGDFSVGVDWHGTIISVPMLQLKNIEAAEETKNSIEDWQYWNRER